MLQFLRQEDKVKELKTVEKINRKVIKLMKCYFNLKTKGKHPSERQITELVWLIKESSLCYIFTWVENESSRQFSENSIFGYYDYILIDVELDSSYSSITISSLPYEVFRHCIEMLRD